jgi:anthranilate synthase/aminodeoxychorismate synthase-like glutamine amidotransferase
VSPAFACRVVLLDNHDSFTWNLAQYLGELGAAVDVCMSDAVTAEEVARRRPDALVISPGPGTPHEAGASVAVVRRLAGRVPILGVCLGHQAIAAAFGAAVVPAARPMHGKTSWVHHTGTGLFRGLPDPFEAMRYHSLLVDPETLPPVLERTAWTAAGEVMGLRHRHDRIDGVQFHPESIGTPAGKGLLANFLAAVAANVRAAAG